MTAPSIKALEARLAEKRAALAKSDTAINALPDLIVAAANGEAVTEHGSRLTMADAVKGADALRQIHSTLTGEIDAIEKRIEREHRVLRSAGTAAEMHVILKKHLQRGQNARP